MKRHANIPIFIPHLGCPNQCVFCNQRHISGVNSFDINGVVPAIEAALETLGTDESAEIAFFGGSFTGIDRELMLRLLEIANLYLQKGAVSSIRCSTRPDYITSEILDILERYGVKTIELGLQSTSDDVLGATKRGHTRIHEQNACKMIVERGFDLVGQMMIGLPASTPESELDTAEFIINSGAKGARIYPTVVFRDTELCDMVERGVYSPLSLEEAIERSVEPMRMLLASGVDVIRIGLCASENLSCESTYYAGPNHPAIGEMIISRLYYKNICAALSEVVCRDRALNIYVSRGSLSKAIGQHRENKHRLMREFGLASINFKESDLLGKYEFKLEFEGDTECT